MNNFEQISIKDFETKPVKFIDKGMLITAGNENSFNTMTASWAGIGFLWQRPVAFIFIRPQRYTLQFVEREAVLTLSFFDETGITPVKFPAGSIAFEEASYVFECKKLYADFLKPECFINCNIPKEIYPSDDFHKMFTLEITQAWRKRIEN